MDVEEDASMARKSHPRKRKTLEDDYGINPSTGVRRIKSVILANTKPSICLKRGIESLHQDRRSLQSEHRRRLRHLLKKLMRKHKYAEASGVMSVLLKGTTKETAAFKTHTKFWATLERIEHIKGDTISSRRIQNICELWMKKLGPMKNWAVKDRFAVHLEFILFYLKRRNTQDAHHGALCYGILLSQRSCICKSWTDLIVRCSKRPLRTEYFMSILNSEGHDAVEGQEANSPFHCDSNTSIRNDKEFLGVDVSQQREVAMVNDDNVPGETQNDKFQPQDFYINSAERNEHEGFSMDQSGLPLWLLPSSNENLEDDLNMHRTLRNDHYKSAVKYLQHALYSSSPVLEAFHPLIQMLLLGDLVKEALDRWKNLLHTPTHHFSRGEYSTEKLMEMIALHLDATHAKCDTWKELACCFLRLSQCEEDCMSVCSNVEDSEKQKFSKRISQIRKIFSDYESSKSWRFRCRWWLTRHFSQNIRTSDIASGDRELLTYKAAMACYLYGRELMYIVKARECLEGEPINKNLYSILRIHANGCTGFYFNV